MPAITDLLAALSTAEAQQENRRLAIRDVVEARDRWHVRAQTLEQLLRVVRDYTTEVPWPIQQQMDTALEANSSHDLLQKLATAEAEGRRQGIEQAAKVVEYHAGAHPIGPLAGVGWAQAIASAVFAVRQLLPVEQTEAK